MDSGILSEITSLIVAVTGLAAAVAGLISVISRIRQRRRHGHDRRALVAPERIDERVDECVEPAPQIGLHLAPRGEGSLGAASVHHEKDLIGGGHQISL
jgi:hypothetical protein